MADEREGEILHLGEDQFRLFDFLKSRSSDFEVSPTLEDIKKGLKLPSVEVASKLVNSLKRVSGIDIFTKVEKKGDESVAHYFLSPETLELTVQKTRTRLEQEEIQKRPITYGALYLAEPGFGTKAYDHERTMKGLRLFLETNGLNRDIQQVTIQGGVIPHVPPYASKANLTALTFLGHIDRKPGERQTVSERMLEDRIKGMDNPYIDEFYGKHVNNDKRRKIVGLSDAFEVAGKQVGILMSAFGEDTTLRIQYGEQDRKNIGHIQDALISNWSREKKEHLEAEEKELEAKRRQLYYGKILEGIESELYKDRTEIVPRNGEKVKEYQKRLFEKLSDRFADKLLDIPDELDLKEKESAQVLKGAARRISSYLYKSAKNPAKIDAKIESRIKNIALQEGEREKELETLETKLEEIHASSGWVSTLLESNRAAITWFTRQYPVQADEAEVAWVIAKNLYTRNYFNWNLLQKRNLHVHVSARKMVKVDTGIMDIATGKPIVSEAEIEHVKYGQKNILMVHSLRSVFSDAVTPRSIKDAKLQSNVENTVLSKLIKGEADSRPDIILLGGHSAGGFRAMPWFKDSERIGDDQFTEGQSISYLINLPTMQSVERLNWLAGHNFSNWDTKRFLTGPYASGAVIHTEDREGVNRYLYVDTKNLIELGTISDEIEVYRNSLKSAKSVKERKSLLDLIKDRKDQAKVHFKKIEAMGDHHLGAPDTPGRYAKDQLIKAFHTYQREHGIPDIISWDEMLHGTMERTFNSQSRYLGEVPEKFRQSIVETVLADPSLTGEQKAYKIAEKAMENMRAITVHNHADQVRLFGLMLKPYAEEALRKGSKVILCSGNHANKSIPVSDEASELANQFPERVRDSGQLKVFAGKGNDVGMGWTTLGNGEYERDRRLFVMHKFPVNQDEGYGIASHLRKMNDTSEIVLAGDRHQPIIGFADGRAYALHPGLEPINTYCPLVGLQAGVRGGINVLYDAKKPGVYGWEMVLNPTLEKIIKRNKIM